ncbi:hypothetical protein [Salmonella enterica]|uniref:hypothetical protein n=1 Tax=Salmonella enterica TaxID=28901 RepID=UPI001CA5CE6D
MVISWTGFIVQDEAQLASELARFRSLVAFNRVLTDRHPDIAEPMVQEYLTAAETSIFSVSGFVAEDGRIVARAAMKVLQRPRKVGIGLCFEGRDIERDGRSVNFLFRFNTTVSVRLR